MALSGKGHPSQTCTWSLGGEDPLEGMATHSSILAWRIPWTKNLEDNDVHRVTKSRTWLKQLSTHKLLMRMLVEAPHRTPSNETKTTSRHALRLLKSSRPVTCSSEERFFPYHMILAVQLSRIQRPTHFWQLHRSKIFPVWFYSRPNKAKGCAKVQAFLTGCLLPYPPSLLLLLT